MWPDTKMAIKIRADVFFPFSGYLHIMIWLSSSILDFQMKWNMVCVTTQTLEWVWTIPTPCTATQTRRETRQPCLQTAWIWWGRLPFLTVDLGSVEQLIWVPDSPPQSTFWRAHPLCTYMILCRSHSPGLCWSGSWSSPFLFVHVYFRYEKSKNVLRNTVGDRFSNVHIPL